MMNGGSSVCTAAKIASSAAASTATVASAERFAVEATDTVRMPLSQKDSALRAARANLLVLREEEPAARRDRAEDHVVRCVLAEVIVVALDAPPPRFQGGRHSLPQVAVAEERV
jgi:hypothetical protein